MLIHLIETGRHHLWRSGPAAWSTGAHAALAASIVVGAMPAHDRSEQRVDREVVYLLPMLPSGRSVPENATLTFRGPEAGRGARGGDGVAAPGPDRALSSTAMEPVRAPDMPVVVDSVERAGTPVYVAADLDRIVERDPTSAGPEYPPELERQQVEGGVLAEWVVDTTGRADSASFRVVAATHPGFVDAVRAALPFMRFRPAELLGHPVQQMVRQEFTFRLRIPPPDSTGRRRAP